MDAIALGILLCRLLELAGCLMFAVGIGTLLSGRLP